MTASPPSKNRPSASPPAGPCPLIWSSWPSASGPAPPFAAAGLTIGASGAIAVDAEGRTSDLAIYAVGDAAEVALPLKRTTGRLSLAFPAQMEARRAADAICGRTSPNRGYLGSFGIEVFGLRAAATGLNERDIEALHIPHDFAYVIPFDRVSLMPGAAPLHLKVHFETPTGRILGAQAVGTDAPDRRIDVIAALMARDGTLEDMASVDLCYAPPFATAKDAVHLAGLVGLNLLHGEFRQVPVSAVRGLVESGTAIIDVREPGEYAAGHIRGAVNVPSLSSGTVWTSSRRTARSTCTAAPASAATTPAVSSLLTASGMCTILPAPTSPSVSTNTPRISSPAAPPSSRLTISIEKLAEKRLPFHGKSFCVLLFLLIIGFILFHAIINMIIFSVENQFLHSHFPSAINPCISTDLTCR